MFLVLMSQGSLNFVNDLLLDIFLICYNKFMHIPDSLTQREIDVLNCFASDSTATNSEAAGRLGISTTTLKMHLQNLCRKNQIEGAGSKRRLIKKFCMKANR